MLNNIADIKKAIQVLTFINQFGSVRLTAQKLYLTQPAVRRYLLRLKKSMGAQLVDRHQHPYHLTVAGRYFFQEARNNYHHQLIVSQRLKILSNDHFQQINLGINSTLASTVLPLVFQQIHQHYPELLLNITEKQNGELDRRLKAEEIDLQIGISNLNRDGIRSVPLFQSGVTLVIPHRLINRKQAALIKPRPVADLSPLLNQLPMLRGISNSGFQSAIDEYLINHHLNVKTVLDNLLMPTGIALIKASAGAMIIPDFLISQAFSTPAAQHQFYFQPIDRQALTYQVKAYWNTWFSDQALINHLVELIKTSVKGIQSESFEGRGSQ